MSRSEEIINKKMECPDCHRMLEPTHVRSYGFLTAEIELYHCNISGKTYQKKLIEILIDVNWM